MDDGARAERAARLRLLLALEIDRITRDLAERLDFLTTVWSRYRRREAFVDTLFSRWRTTTFGDLTLLDEEAILAVEAFYAELEQVQLYVRYTEDMPTTLRDHLELRARRLERAADRAVDVLGGVPDDLFSDPLPALPLDVSEDA